MPRKALTASVADDHAAPGGAAAVDRALTLLAAFRAGDQALSLAELAARTQLYKSTALRLLASLEHARFIQRLEDGRYALGVEVARLHAIYARAGTAQLDHLVLPVLQDLVAATGESAAYHVLRGDAAHRSRLCLYRVDSPHPIRDHVKAGDLLPADRGAGARVLMAFAGPQAKVPASDRALLAQVRVDGYCALVGDRSAELAGISAPVFKSDGTLAAALTLTMPAHRYTLDHLAPVLAAARRLTGQI
ncbi:IclR family transcriptional regulator [Variovorax sp. HJSM1_2]|uniref:IclR family transcriptional regulator n=1 Tax=Variovorax sp. HJSM1_2 TaxID=3366263 RepID=UPI003BD0EDB4